MLWVSFLIFFFALIVFSFFQQAFMWVMDWEIFNVAGIYLSVTLVYDFFSLLFFFIVLLVAGSIFFFSQYYMDVEKNFKGFVMLLFLFVTAMMFLIFSPSILFLLLGWDGLGVTSYLLVIYYMNYSSSVAGMLTFCINRLGDVFFFGTICLLMLTSSWSFFEMKGPIFFMGGMMILAFSTKSAQVPFSSWLPAAMSAPTPVSSLVHSSTLVTAGVFLMIRFYNVLLGYMSFLLVMAVFTICMAGVMAVMDWDMKKIIAFSTLSQLGFMVVAYSMGLVLFSFFHLLTHALFKASLFMCSGVLIHNLDNLQDFRNSAQFLKIMPVLSMIIVVCILCLCGFPFSSGFFSKDYILDGGSINFFFFFFFLFGVFLTFFYSLRFSFLAMLKLNISRNLMLFFYEKVIYILFPVFFLGSMALLFGYIGVELGVLFSSLGLMSYGWKLSYIFFMTIIVGGVVSFFFEKFITSKQYFFSDMWFLSTMMGLRMFKYFLVFSQSLFMLFDLGWLEKLGPSGMYNSIMSISSNLNRQLSFFFLMFIFLFFFFII